MERQPLSLLWGSKAGELCNQLFSMYARFRYLFPKALLKEAGLFFSTCSEKFLKEHDLNELRRIFFSYCRIIQKLNVQSDQRVHLEQLHFSALKIGITVVLTSLKERELFNEHHLQRGIQNLIPGIQAIKHSYVCWSKGTHRLFYIEVKKIRGGAFKVEERKRIQDELPFELLQRIEPISQSLFLPGNEEELFKNVRHLANELHYLSDLPQVMISFVEYINETLKFLVICLRVNKPGMPTIVEQSSLLPTIVRFSLENLFSVEKLRKRYPKEAAIFTLEVSSSLFLRNRNSVNLRAARQYIVKSLEHMLGSFRDYNGGLLVQEDRQLFEMKRALEKRGLFFHGVEDFFYSIKPVSLRATFSTEIGSQFVEMIQKMVACPLPQGKKYHLEFYIGQKFHLVVIQTSERSWKARMPKKILAVSSQIGFSYTEDDHYLYLCFFHLNPSKPVMFKALLRALAESVRKVEQRSALRMNFQGGDPSSVNPRFAADIHSNVLASFLFEGLMRFSPEGDIENAIAQKIEVDGNTYRFHLRPSWWSCGEEVSAYDFEKSWKKAIVSPAAACIKPDFFYPILNAKKAHEGLCSINEIGVWAENSSTLKVELQSPCPHFLNLLATPSFFPLYGEDEDPSIFNGPFVLADWKSEEEILLSQNPFYWNARQIKLSGIRISLIKDAKKAYQMFLNHELDIIGDPISPLPPQTLQFLGEKLMKKSINRVFWIHCNLQKSPMNNPHLRKALSLAINRRKIVEKVFVHQIPTCSALPVKYAKLKGNLEADVELAKKHFKIALEELGEIPVLQMIHSNLSFEKSLSDELKNQWSQVLGIEVMPHFLPWSEFSSALENGNFDLGGLFRRDLFNDVMFYFSFFEKTSDNIHSWDNPEYENLLAELKKGHDRKKKIEELERLIDQQMPVIPLVNQRNLMLVNERIKGVEWNLDGGIDVKKVRICHEAGTKTIDSSCSSSRMSSEERRSS